MVTASMVKLSSTQRAALKRMYSSHLVRKYLRGEVAAAVSKSPAALREGSGKVQGRFREVAAAVSKSPARAAGAARRPYLSPGASFSPKSSDLVPSSVPGSK